MRSLQTVTMVLTNALLPRCARACKGPSSAWQEGQSMAFVNAASMSLRREAESLCESASNARVLNAVEKRILSAG